MMCAFVKTVKFALTAIFMIFTFNALSGCSVFNWATSGMKTPAKAEMEVKVAKAKKDKKSSSSVYKLPITTIRSGKIYFQNYHARAKGDELVISGFLRSRYGKQISVRGHVDAKIYDGDVLIAESSVQQSPKVLHGRGIGRRNKGSSFKILLSQKLPEDSRVVLWFHRNKMKSKYTVALH